MTSRDEEQGEYVLHTTAIYAACKAAGLDLPIRRPEDPWWFDGPHIEMSGRAYYVHALGCFASELGRATREHPGWYLVVVASRGGREYEIHGLHSDLVTLGEISERAVDLSPDEIRLAIELTPREKRQMWGVPDPEA